MPNARQNRVARALVDPKVRHDIRVVGRMVEIYCHGNHSDRSAHPLTSPAQLQGVYTRGVPVLCEECSDHLRYAEERRALCPKNPKPFCANCDIHCYRSDEAEWERQMMRYSGPRSVFHGLAIDAIKHVIETIRYRKSHRKR